MATMTLAPVKTAHLVVMIKNARRDCHVRAAYAAPHRQAGMRITAVTITVGATVETSLALEIRSATKTNPAKRVNVLPPEVVKTPAAATKKEVMSGAIKVRNALVMINVTPGKAAREAVVSQLQMTVKAPTMAKTTTTLTTMALKVRNALMIQLVTRSNVVRKEDARPSQRVRTTTTTPMATRVPTMAAAKNPAHPIKSALLGKHAKTASAPRAMATATMDKKGVMGLEEV